MYFYVIFLQAILALMIALPMYALPVVFGHKTSYIIICGVVLFLWAVRVHRMVKESAERILRNDDY